MQVWGITKKYKSLSWFENFMSGHLNIGRLTIYGENAMHWAVNIKTKRWGYLCFRLPFRCFGRWWPLYFYCSPNGTPWASTYYIGTGHQAKNERRKARLRKESFGHNYNTQLHQEDLRKINNS